MRECFCNVDNKHLVHHLNPCHNVATAFVKNRDICLDLALCLKPEEWKLHK